MNFIVGSFCLLSLMLCCFSVCGGSCILQTQRVKGAVVFRYLIWFMAAVSLRLLVFNWLGDRFPPFLALNNCPYLYSIGLATSDSSSWVLIGVVVTHSCLPCTHRISGRLWFGTHFQLFYTKRTVNLAKCC